MYRIVKKRVLNPTVTLMEIEAPIVARKAEPGQFIILRVDEAGERIPQLRGNIVDAHVHDAGGRLFGVCAAHADCGCDGPDRRGQYLHQLTADIGGPERRERPDVERVLTDGLLCGFLLFHNSIPPY